MSLGIHGRLPPPHRAQKLLLLLCVASALSGCRADRSYTTLREEAEIWVGSTELLEAEDARGNGAEIWATLGAGLENADARVRARTARALGRMERTDVVPLLLPMLGDEDARVRAEAANGLAQAVWTIAPPTPAEGGAEGDSADLPSGPTAVDTIAMVLDSLIGRVAVEEDARVRSTLATALGRLPVVNREQAESVQGTLVGMAPDSLASEPPLLATGLALGLQTLARRTPGEPILSREAKSLLVEMFRFTGGTNGTPTDWARLRRAALSAYTFAGPPLDGVALRETSTDPDPQVRRLAVRVLGAAAGGPGSWTPMALEDSAATVRIAALRTAAPARPDRDCSPLFGALQDPDPLVASTAADLLGGPCDDQQRQVDALSSLIREFGEDWHAPAHALVSLARVGGPGAADGANRLAEHASPFARAWAARAATELRMAELLQTLATDSSANVRTAAISGLATAQGHGADDVIAAQLEARDPQLVMTAASLLNGSPRMSRWGPAMLDALDRMSEAGNDTFRDVRAALVMGLAGYAEAAGSAGRTELVNRLTPYLADYDPVIATSVAELLTSAQDAPVTATPQPRANLPIPGARQLEALSGATVVLAMAKGDTIRIRLLPGVAPTNAFRFARLARAGYFDGLTFHRVVPNFVIQGGSPGANEYWGDGPFSRDEVGLIHHWRGTVGLSTRGRDTGDAQIFVNLVDNLRLDFDYTIFGEVVEGMEAVDRVLEGDVIERAWVEPRVR